MNAQLLPWIGLFVGFAFLYAFLCLKERKTRPPAEPWKPEPPKEEPIKSEAIATVPIPTDPIAATLLKEPKKPNGVIIGERDGCPYTIPYSVRNQHVYILGLPGYGKSTLLFAMALQDIQNRKGICVLDPKGDLVEQLLKHIPPDRKDDVIYMAGVSPVPVDFMGWRDDLDREYLMGDLIGTFKQVAQDAQGTRWPAVLQWTLKALLENRHCSFLDIYYFLADEDKRQRILDDVTDEDILRFWELYPKALPKDSAMPLLNRMTPLLTRSAKGILGYPNPKLGNPKTLLNISDVMESGKILLVNLTNAARNPAM